MATKEEEDAMLLQLPTFMQTVENLFAECDHLREVNADLLAALEVLLSACVALDEANARQMVDPHAEDNARAAIAKAEEKT